MARPQDPPQGSHPKTDFIEAFLDDVVAGREKPRNLAGLERRNELLAQAIIDTSLPPIQPPEHVKHQNPVSALGDLMFGQLTTTLDGLLFVPDAARERQARLRFDFLMSPVNDVVTQEEHNMAQRFLEFTQTGTPRFLFRGFNPSSGGGFDSKLNSPEGVTPHAFLDGKMPTNIWDIESLFHMIDLHLGYDPSISSPFSSWTHYLTTAIGFAHCDTESRIAVLDTASLRQNVFFSHDLWRAALTDRSYMNEFLIYGPISGPHYHTVSVVDLFKRTNAKRILLGDRNAVARERISAVERGAVEASREMATFLQPLGTNLENIVILTARFVGVRIARIRPGRRYLRRGDVHGFLYYIRDDLQTLAIRHDATEISLVEPTMDTSYSQGLKFEVHLQQAAEDAVRVMGWLKLPITSRGQWIDWVTRMVGDDRYRREQDVADRREVNVADERERDVADTEPDGADAMELDETDNMEVDVVNEMDLDGADDVQPDVVDEMEL